MGQYSIRVHDPHQLGYRWSPEDPEDVATESRKGWTYTKGEFMTRMHNPAHPGEVLRDYLLEGLRVSDAAKHLAVTRQALSAVLNGRAGISAEMALRLEGALGTSAEMWIEMQAGFDLWRARQRPKPKVSKLAA